MTAADKHMAAARQLLVGRRLAFSNETGPEELIQAIATALATAEREGMKRAAEWQSAETAPRDGSEFIACNRGFAPFTCRFWQGGFVHYDFDEGVIRYGFDLWRPLPTPPSEAERTA